MKEEIESTDPFSNFFQLSESYSQPEEKKLKRRTKERHIYLNEEGLPHNLNGPAILYPNGTEEWAVDGKPHRIDGPAISRRNGRREWWSYGRRHRVDGPAITLKMNGRNGG